MPANFDEVLWIGFGSIRWPQGPLTDLDPTEVPNWVEAWVIQANTGAAASFAAGPAGFATANRWIANNPVWQKGVFQPGPAKGIALIWGTVTSPAAVPFPTHFEWTDDVQLR
jgi:hypothetical protein